MTKYAALIIFVVATIGCQSKGNYDSQAVEVAKLLVRATIAGEDIAIGNPAKFGVVHVGSGLIEKLSELKPNLSQKCSYTLTEDKETPRASHAVIVSCNSRSLIGLRLNYDSKHEAFHILGWWTRGF